MHLKDIFNYCVSSLALYKKEEKESIVYILLGEVFLIPKVDILLNVSTEITKEEIKPYLDRLNQGEPIQYLSKIAPFYGLKLKIEQGALIPRPETEELVDEIINRANNKANLKVLDIGTGSGCIAIALGKNLNNAEVTAIDISEKALKVAKNNAKQLNVKVDFKLVDVFSHNLNEKFDIIVSNPPYVLESEREAMDINVLSFEPENALFVPNSSPLVYYEKITEIALEFLNEKGLLAFEINEKFGSEVLNLLIEKGFAAQLKKDINKKDRMVFAIKV